MSELTFEQMLDASLKTIHAGEVVEGTVIDVKPEEAVLNIGCKSDGILTRNEYSNDSNLDLTTVVKPGDTMEVKVLKVNDGEGQVLLTYKRLAADRGNKRIEEAFNNHEVLKAKVTQVLDGGLIVVDEVRIFIPASLVSDTYEKDLTKYADQEIEFVISEYNPKRRRYIGDHQITMCRAISSFTAILESLTFTIRFPPIEDTTVISVPATNPRFSRKRLVSSFPPTFTILLTSPIVAIVKGICSTFFLLPYFRSFLRMSRLYQVHADANLTIEKFTFSIFVYLSYFQTLVSIF